MILYKLTDRDGYTRRGQSGETKWGQGVTHSASGDGAELCTSGVIHAYQSWELALMLNPIHANIFTPVVWEAEGEIVASDRLKVGVKSLATLRQVAVPEITTAMRVRFAIMCALQVYGGEPRFVRWANEWLDGTNRSRAEATAAMAAAEAAMAAAVARS